MTIANSPHLSLMNENEEALIEKLEDEINLGAYFARRDEETVSLEEV